MGPKKGKKKFSENPQTNAVGNQLAMNLEEGGEYVSTEGDASVNDSTGQETPRKDEGNEEGIEAKNQAADNKNIIKDIKEEEKKQEEEKKPKNKKSENNITQAVAGKE